MADLPYRDAGLPVSERVEDLLGRMTLAEKVRQMDQYQGTGGFVDELFPNSTTAMAKDGRILLDKVAAAFGDNTPGCIHDLYPPDAAATNTLQRYAVEETRLGIPILFSEEALHGLNTPGTTIFPQAITVASAWNPEVAKRVGAGIAAECRAFGIHETFSPVVDISRDPRWGRMEETFGEDVYLVTRTTVAMIEGMQGAGLDSDRSILAEVKHFAAYGMTRGGINCATTHVGERELRSVFLPPFEAAVREAGILSIMCSYTAVDGEPCASSRWLMTDVLRGEWGFAGFVRADLGAIRRLEGEHQTAPDAAEAIRQSVAAGMDMQYYDYGTEQFQQTLMALAGSGELDEAAIDRAVRGILTAKFRLGLFENPYTDPGLVAERVRCAAHIETSLDAARQGIVLLKNEDSLLPLDPAPKRIAVIGPCADVPCLGDYTPPLYGFEASTVLDGLRAQLPEAELTYVKGVSVVPGELDAVPSDWLSPAQGEGPGLYGEYFPNLDLDGEPAMTRVDGKVDFNWILAQPTQDMAANYSVRWTGTLTPDRSFEGFFGTSAQDSMRLFVDGERFVDGWDQCLERNLNNGRTFTFEAGRSYAVRCEFKRDRTAVQVRLGYAPVEGDLSPATDAAANADLAICCLGDAPGTCGEGYDRAGLNLPGNQLDLLKAVHATGTPIVLVLQIGRALDLSWEAAHIPAIVNAWFAGERGGQAIAEILTGVINPAGRLPVSFPRSVGQVPVYHAQPRFGLHTYLDLSREPLYPLGHGLSYTTFCYSPPRVMPECIAPSGEMAVEVDVTNTGNRAGDEVAQCYLRDVVSSTLRPEWELRGYQRVHLEPGETKTVRFALGTDALKLLDKAMRWTVEPGEFRVRCGGSSNLEGSPEAVFRVEG